MELLQLRYFCMVAHYQNITRAAAELMISQPALSQTIRKLEQEVGVPLFERRGKYIHLNRMGEVFYTQVLQALNSLDDGVSLVSDMRETPSGEIHVLVQGASNFLPDLYLAFHSAYPHVHLRLSNQTQSDQLQVSDYDLTIYTVTSYVPSRNAVPLLRERMVLAVPQDHPLAGRECVDLAEAAPYPFLITNIYTYLNDICRAAGFTPNVRTQCDNTFTFSRLIRQGLGISVVPEITIGADVVKGLSLVPFRNPSSERTVALSWNANRYLSSAGQLFREMALQFFGEAQKDPRALPLPPAEGETHTRRISGKEQLLWSDF